MAYKLTITKFAPNEDYDEQMKAYKSSQEYNFQRGKMLPYPAQNTEVRVLDVEVTDEMFAAIRKACLEAM